MEAPIEVLRIEQSTVSKEITRFRACDNETRCFYCRDWAQYIYKKHFVWTAKTQEEVVCQETFIKAGPYELSFLDQDVVPKERATKLAKRFEKLLSKGQARAIDIFEACHLWTKLPSAFSGLPDMFDRIEFNPFPDAIPLVDDDTDPAQLLDPLVIERQSLCLPSDSFHLLKNLTGDILLSHTQPTCDHMKPESKSPSDLEVDRVIFNEKVAGIIDTALKELKLALDRAWAPLYLFLEKMEDHERQRMHLMGNDCKTEMDEFVKNQNYTPFVDYWTSNQASFKKKKGVSAEDELKNIDKMVEDRLSELKAKLDQFLTDFAIPRLEKIQVLTSDLWKLMVPTFAEMGKRMEQISLEKKGEKPKKLFKQPSQITMDEVDSSKEIRMAKEIFIKELKERIASHKLEIDELMVAYREARPDLSGRTEKLNNKDFKKRVKKVESGYYSLRQFYHEQVISNLFPDSLFCKCVLYCLEPLMQEGEVMEAMTIEKEIKRFIENHSELLMRRCHLLDSFEEGVQTGRSELAGILGKLFLKEGMRIQGESLALKRQNMLLKSMGVSDTEPSQKKKSKKKKGNSSSGATTPGTPSEPPATPTKPVEEEKSEAPPPLSRSERLRLVVSGTRTVDQKPKEEPKVEKSEKKEEANAKKKTTKAEDIKSIEKQEPKSAEGENLKPTKEENTKVIKEEPKVVKKAESKTSKKEEPEPIKKKESSKKEKSKVNKEETKEVKTEEPKPVTKEEPNPTKKEEPKVVKKEEPKPVKKEEPKPIKKEEPKPVKKEEPKPIKKEEPKPVKKEEPKPVKKEEPKPAKKEEPKVVQKEEPKPVKKEEPKPVKKEEPKPVKEEPKPAKKEEPKVVKKEEPKPVKNEDPKPVKKEEPKPVKEEPRPVKKEEPKPVKEEPKKEEPKPVTKEEAKPVNKKEPAPTKKEKLKTEKKEELKPVNKEEPKPVEKKEPIPAKKEELKTVKKEESKPINKEEPKPTKKEEPKPIEKEEPKQLKEPEPKSVMENECVLTSNGKEEEKTHTSNSNKVDAQEEKSEVINREPSKDVTKDKTEVISKGNMLDDKLGEIVTEEEKEEAPRVFENENFKIVWTNPQVPGTEEDSIQDWDDMKKSVIDSKNTLQNDWKSTEKEPESWNDVVKNVIDEPVLNWNALRSEVSSSPVKNNVAQTVSESSDNSRMSTPTPVNQIGASTDNALDDWTTVSKKALNSDLAGQRGFSSLNKAAGEGWSTAKVSPTLSSSNSWSSIKQPISSATETSSIGWNNNQTKPADAQTLGGWGSPSTTASGWERQTKADATSWERKPPTSNSATSSPSSWDRKNTSSPSNTWDRQSNTSVSNSATTWGNKSATPKRWESKPVTTTESANWTNAELPWNDDAVDTNNTPKETPAFKTTPKPPGLSKVDTPPGLSREASPSFTHPDKPPGLSQAPSPSFSNSDKPPGFSNESSLPFSTISKPPGLAGPPGVPMESLSNPANIPSSSSFPSNLSGINNPQPFSMTMNQPVGSFATPMTLNMMNPLSMPLMAMPNMSYQAPLPDRMEEMDTGAISLLVRNLHQQNGQLIQSVHSLQQEMTMMTSHYTEVVARTREKEAQTLQLLESRRKTEMDEARRYVQQLETRLQQLEEQSKNASDRVTAGFGNQDLFAGYREEMGTNEHRPHNTHRKKLWSKTSVIRCGNCGKTGHSSNECRSLCRYCGSSEHLSDSCPGNN